MTERAKQTVTKTLAGFTMTLLILIATGIGYLIVKGDEKDSQQDDRLLDNDKILYNVAKTLEAHSEWIRDHDLKDAEFKSETKDEFMELWKEIPRGATVTNNNTVKK